MRLGVCTSVAESAVLKKAGWDYVEENVQAFLRGQDQGWDRDAAMQPGGGALAVEAACMLVPGKMKITGEKVEFAELETYIGRVMQRAGSVGIRTLVFGSGGARNVPDGFSRSKAREQIIAFARMAADKAQEHHVTIALEHLNKAECNIINSVAEATEYVKAVSHPHFCMLVDSYHLWQEKEGLEAVVQAMPWICHVHVADPGSRCAPGQCGGEVEKLYREFFGVLRKGGYDGRISVEAKWAPALGSDAGSVRERLLRWWEGAGGGSGGGALSL